MESPESPTLVETTPQIGELAKALAAVQAEMLPATRGEEGQIGSQRYKYADLSAVWSAAQPALGNAGLAVIQVNEFIDGRDYICTTLAHISGEYIRGRIPVFVEPEHRGINNAQAFGSGMQYAKRYALAAMIGIVIAGDDDDGAGAGDPGQKRQPRRQNDNHQAGKMPSDEHGDAVCIAFHKPPSQEQKKALLDRGFVWSGEKFRWEAPPSDKAISTGKAILGRSPDLVKWHRGILPQDSQEAAESPPEPDPPGADPKDGEDAPAFGALSKAALLGTVQAMETRHPEGEGRRPKALSEMSKPDLVAYAQDLQVNDDDEIDF
jgi:hypothetical protein